MNAGQFFKPGEVLVQKFGGSSMASPERILKVAERIAEQARVGRKMAIVVSAMGDTTDDLISLMGRISPDPQPREIDQLLATGEIVSVSVMAAALKRVGVKARSFIATNLGIRTDDSFGNAQIVSFDRLRDIAGFLDEGGVAVIAGFQGVTSSGDITTLGRGGSDITAVALARELGQKLCEKFTDEDGVYTADPRIIPNARKVWHLDYNEMESLANNGNGILHIRSIAYARDAAIRIHVRSSFSREEGSVIGPDGDPKNKIKSMAVDKKQAVMAIEGIRFSSGPGPHLKEKFGFPVTAVEWRSFDQIRGSLRVGFRLSDSFEAIPDLWEFSDSMDADEVRFTSHLAMISIVGCGLSADASLAARLVQPLQGQGLQPLLVDRDGIRLTLAIPQDQASLAMMSLHETMIALLKT